MPVHPSYLSPNPENIYFVANTPEKLAYAEENRLLSVAQLEDCAGKLVLAEKAYFAQSSGFIVHFTSHGHGRALLKDDRSNIFIVEKNGSSWHVHLPDHSCWTPAELATGKKNAPLSIAS